jgi:hypothetical protein
VRRLRAIVDVRAAAQRPSSLARERHGHVGQADARDVVPVLIGLGT